jgi:hypothetical protein
VKVAISLLPAAFVCLFSQAFASPDSSSPQETTATPTTTTAPASDAKATTSSTTSPDAAKTSSNKTVLVDKTVTDAQVKQLLAQGYKPQASGDSVWYCHREQVLGTHFETRVCRTAEQMGLLRNDANEFMEQSRLRTTKLDTGK